MRAAPEQCSVIQFLVDPSEIHFLRFILEAYEGIAVVSTIDRTLGLVQVSAAPGCQEEVLTIVRSERDRLRLREITGMLKNEDKGQETE